MPLLMVIVIGAVVLWLLLSVFFEAIGNVTIRLLSRFKNKSTDININREENNNE